MPRVGDDPRPVPPSEPTLGVDGADLPSPRAGVALPARYRDLGEIGRGAFGEVRRVEDQHLHSVLAMKILRIEHGGNVEAARRLAREARLTAWLHHPGIVTVQDLGTLDDGRTWYTMEEVRGETFGAVIAALHASEGGTPWTLRRAVDALMRACQAVASAHARGVIHRDLKPDNVMVGAFGEVRVMDWGIARVLAQAEEDPAGQPEAPGGGTLAGSVLGTPSFMPPEQARGELHRVGPAADVYALGGMLYMVLTGRAPYEGSSRSAWLAVLHGPPPDPRTTAPWRLPEELVSICLRAMAREPEDRPPDAGALADALGDWLEGARRTAEAEAQVERVRARWPLALEHRREAQRLEREGRAALDGVPPSAPTAEKLTGWRLEEAARGRLGEARRIEAELVRDLRSALVAAPELAAAHELLADLYRARLEEAETRGDLDAVEENEVALREHDRGKHAVWLQGDGAVTLVTDPPGARVEVWRFEERDRRLVEVPAGELGVTPLQDARLPRGSYVLVLRKAGFAPVRYPVQIGRLERWDGVRPGDTDPHPVWLPRQDELGPGSVYVPAGWFWSGGDPQALDALSRRRLWVDGYLIRRFPVAAGEYLGFLCATGDDRWAPRLLAHADSVFPRDADGQYALPERAGDAMVPYRADEPITLVNLASARAYARWFSARGGLEWRLPHDQEWEKAARGVDGRVYPWGNHLDPSWTRMQLTHAGAPRRALNEEHPEDISPYGVRGMGGNSRDWCANAYARSGPPPDQLIVRPEDAPEDAAHIFVRGGSMGSSEALCRAASRFVSHPAIGGAMVGVRLVAGLPVSPACR